MIADPRLWLLKKLKWAIDEGLPTTQFDDLLGEMDQSQHRPVGARQDVGIGKDVDGAEQHGA
jgi:hypothetical protein